MTIESNAQRKKGNCRTCKVKWGLFILPIASSSSHIVVHHLAFPNIRFKLGCFNMLKATVQELTMLTGIGH
jgi:hypothetical protein